MKERILRLCKRLNKFSLDEIETISEIEQSDLQIILNELIDEKRIIINNGIYIYKKQMSSKHKFSLLRYYKSETIDLMIKCFCLAIPCCKAQILVTVGDNQSRKFYNIFRTLIYEKQMKILEKFYCQCPQNARRRMFLGEKVYLYFYNKQVYISKKLLKSKNDAPLTPKEKQDFTMIYCYLARNLTSNKSIYNLEEKIAELIWRRNRSFDELYPELKNMLL